MDDSIEKLKHDLKVLASENQLLKQKYFNQAIEIEKARALETRYKAIIENTGALAKIGSWEYNPQQNSVYWSDEIFRIQEVDPTIELTVDFAMQRFAKEHRSLILSAFQNALNHHQPYDLVLQIVTPSGRRKWVRALGNVFEEQGAVTKVFGTLQDIDLENNVRIKLDEIISVGNRLISSKLKVDYGVISNTICSISEAHFVALNLWDSDQKAVLTADVAFHAYMSASDKAQIKTAFTKQRWLIPDSAHPVLEQKWVHKYKSTNKYSELVENQSVFCDLLKAFDIGHVYFIPLMNGEKAIGSFMLFYKRNNELRFHKMVEIFANQVANELSKYELHDAILQRERKYRRLIENSSDITAIVSQKGFFTYVSPNVTQIFGWHSNELINRKFCDFAKNEAMNIECDSLLAWIEKNGHLATGEFLFQQKDGSYAWVRLTGVSMLNDPVICGIIINFSDITEQKKAEELSRKLQLAVENNPLSIVITNSEGAIEYVNTSFTIISGYSLSEILGKKTSIFKSGLTPIEFYQDMWSTILNGKEWKGEMQNKRKNGELFWEAISINSIKNPKGIITHFVAVKEDITRHRELASELEKRNLDLIEADNEKNKFFSIIAHDLRGPFNAFLGLTEFMHDELPEMDVVAAQNIASDLNRTAHNIYELLNNLLTWSRIKMGTMAFEPQPVCLLQLVNNSIQFVSDAFIQKGTNLNVTIDGHLNVIADVNMITSVVHNLTSNALKFTPSGGLIKIGASEIPGGLVRIEIQDSGIGMEPKILENLFKTDVKINRPGTDNEPSVGLGLLLCREFVVKHGGTIWATSEKDKGSQFYFTLYKAKNE